MALYAFDGTGKEDEQDDTRDSNLVDFFSAYIDPNKNADPDTEVGSLYLKVFLNARRAGLPIDQAAIDRNFADRGMPQESATTGWMRRRNVPSFKAIACTSASSWVPGWPVALTTIRRSR